LGLGIVYAASRAITIYWDFGAAASELPDAAAAYRAAGLPWTAAELQPTVLPNENAAPLLREVFKALPGEAIDQQFDKDIRSGTTAALMPRYEPSLALLRKALRRPKLDFKRDWDSTVDLSFPEVGNLQRVGKVLVVRAESSAAKGNDEAAIADLEDAYRVAVLTAQEPMLISMLKSISIEKEALAAAERCLVYSRGDQRRIACYQRWLSQPRRLPDARYALKGEIYLSLSFARNFDRYEDASWKAPFQQLDILTSESPSTPKSSDFRREGFPSQTVARAYMARHNQLWTELFISTHGLTANHDSINRTWDAIDERAMKSKGMSYGLSPLLFPKFAQALKSPTLLLAARAKARGLAEAMCVYARSGQWPTTVSPTDPFTGKPLLVRRNGKGIRVYSVGKDGKDNGGASQDEPRSGGTQEYDEVAAYPPIVKAKTSHAHPRSYGSD
jgi:hypothetical protein